MFKSETFHKIEYTKKLNFYFFFSVKSDLNIIFYLL